MSLCTRNLLRAACEPGPIVNVDLAFPKLTRNEYRTLPVRCRRVFVSSSFRTVYTSDVCPNIFDLDPEPEPESVPESASESHKKRPCEAESPRRPKPVKSVLGDSEMAHVRATHAILARWTRFSPTWGKIIFSRAKCPTTGKRAPRVRIPGRSVIRSLAKEVNMSYETIETWFHLMAKSIVMKYLDRVAAVAAAEAAKESGVTTNTNTANADAGKKTPKKKKKKKLKRQR